MDLAAGEPRATGFVGPWTRLAWLIGLLTALYYAWVALVGITSPALDRSLFVFIGIGLALAIKPLAHNVPARLLDAAMFAVAAYATLHFNLRYVYYMENAGFGLDNLDIGLGVAIVIISIEAARRALGLAIPLITLVFLAYLYLGPWAPGALRHRGFDTETIFSNLYASTEGLYGVITYTLASTLFLFLVFGQFLVRSGASQFFSDLCLSFLGRSAGGGAKAAVSSSFIVGSVTGSAAANVAITGVITIPLMKRTGYKAHIAGAIEAAASTGGTVMPPVMGTAAFIMVALTGIGYADIALYSAIPAIMYFSLVYLQVHFYAKRNGLRGLPENELRPTMEVLRTGWFHFIPIVIVVTMVYLGYSLARTALFAIIASILCSWLSSTRMGLRDILDTLSEGTRHSLSIIAVAAPVSVMTLAILLPGTGLKITGMLIDLAGGNLAATLAMIFVIGYILGMGLSVVPAYIILATLAAPALIRMDVPVMAAHFVVMWWGIASNITPPVALASYVAANIAGSPMWQTGNAAVVKGAGLFFIPVLFVYQPGLLFMSDWLDNTLTITSIIAGIVILSGAIEGYLFRTMSAGMRALYYALGALLILAHYPQHVIAMFAITAVVLLWDRREARRATPEPTADTTEIPVASSARQES